MRRSILLPATIGAIASVAVLAACDGEDTLVPEDRIIATGTYEYDAEWLHPASEEWETLGGALVLEHATPDSVHGRWVLSGYVPDSTGGYWNENAYVLAATSADGIVTITHRLWRFGSPSEILCSLTFSQRRPDGLPPLTTGGNCEMVHGGP